MGGACEASSQACGHADYFHVGIHVSHIHPDLFKGPARGEGAESDNKWNLALEGQSGGKTDAVLLGDANVEKLVGEALGKGRKSHRAHQIGG